MAMGVEKYCIRNTKEVSMTGKGTNPMLDSSLPRPESRGRYCATLSCTRNPGKDFVVAGAQPVTPTAKNLYRIEVI